MSATIEFLIEEDGKATVTVKGVKGSACEQITDFIERHMRVTDRMKTEDYYKEDRKRERENNRIRSH